jgi:outer membrane lipoprotein-sorting protein
MRRVTLTVIAVLCAATLSAADNQDERGKDAGQLFQRMEAKLHSAKTLSLSFDSTVESESIPIKGWKLKGTVAVMDGKKARLEMSGGKTGGDPFKGLLISDGTRMVQDHGKLQSAPKVCPSNLITEIARSGFFITIMPLPPEPFTNPDFDLKDGFSVSGFRLGKKDKIGERETQRVDYVLSVKGNEGQFPAAVWIDLKTGLPVKRELTGMYTENYELTLDGNLDPKLFELPK